MGHRVGRGVGQGEGQGTGRGEGRGNGGEVWDRIGWLVGEQGVG